MVDLKSQYLHIKNDVDKAISKVIDSSQFINGDEVKSFQKELASYMDVKHVITCGNGTDALQISMMALGLKPGDEVITPSFTYIATTEVIGLLGLKPVFVDCDLDTFNISWNDNIKARIVNQSPQNNRIKPHTRELKQRSQLLTYAYYENKLIK